jgi:VanZ family protein
LSRVRDGRFHGGYLLAAAIVAGVILYGSLYPFAFRYPASGIGPIQALLKSWAQTPQRGDFVANILFYMPFGFFASLGIGTSVLPALWIAIVCGALLSASMEVAQYYVAGRVSSGIDIYADIIGTALGALIGVVAGRNTSWPIFRTIASNRVPCLLLGLWLGYRLFPYVPTLDLQKHWSAIKPLVLYPNLTGYDLFRHTAIWLTIGALLEAIAGPRRAWLLLSLFVGSVLVAKILIVAKTLSAAELAGAGLALGAWLVLAASTGPRFRVILITLLFFALVVVERLVPFHFSADGRHFGWIPFHSFIYGSVEVNIMSFFEKAFLYGGLIWLICRAGLRPGISTILVASMLFATSWAGTHLAGRSAEITDTVMALLMGAIIALMETKTRATTPLSS